MRRGIHLFKFLPVLLLYYGVDNAWGRYTPKHPCARMMEKSGVQFGIWFSTWNVRSMLGKCGEISETLKRHCADICCLQEVRWKGQGAKMIGNGFKFLWSGGCKAENSVSVIVAYWLIGKVVGVEGCNDSVRSILLLGCSLGGSILLLSTGW